MHGHKMLKQIEKMGYEINCLDSGSYRIIEKQGVGAILGRISISLLERPTYTAANRKLPDDLLHVLYENCGEIQTPLGTAVWRRPRKTLPSRRVQEEKIFIQSSIEGAFTEIGAPKY